MGAGFRLSIQPEVDGGKPGESEHSLGLSDWLENSRNRLLGLLESFLAAGRDLGAYRERGQAAD